MKTGKSLRIVFSNFCLAVLAGNLLLQPVALKADPGLPKAAQLSFARQVSINESSASAGQTVFNGNHLKVARHGTAIVNVGWLGRIELGAESDFILRLAGNTLGGELRAGCMTISVPAGVAIALNNGLSAINSDGQQPVALSVGFLGGATNITPTLGEIKIVRGGRTERAGPGEMITLTGGTAGESSLLRRKTSDCQLPSAACACNAAALPRANGTISPALQKPRHSSILYQLLGTAMTASTIIFFASTTNNGQALTCVNSRGIFCLSLSSPSP